MSEPRLIAIGDIHGCLDALDLLTDAIEPRPEDEFVVLGDFVDRGPNSRGVIQRLIAWKRIGRLTVLRGNHELMMLRAKAGRDDFRFWHGFGGAETLASYGRWATLNDVPEEHWHFIESTCNDWYETDKNIFAHAGIDPAKPFDQQSEGDLHWSTFSNRGPHVSGKILVCGHTEQPAGRPCSIGHAICIDTGVCHGNWLTALNVLTGEYWQSNDFGQRRGGRLDEE